MQTEADVPPVTSLPIEESSTVTRFTLVKEEPVTDTMTVKEAVEPAEEEEEQVLCPSHGEVFTGVEQEPGVVPQGLQEFRYSESDLFSREGLRDSSGPFVTNICKKRFLHPLPYSLLSLVMAMGFHTEINIFSLLEPCVLYIGQAHRYPPNTPFYIFFQQIYVLNFLKMLHNLRFFLYKMPFIS
jgi:hypothetical protein